MLSSPKPSQVKLDKIAFDFARKGVETNVPEKNASKRAKISVILAKNTCFQADFFLAELGGTPPPLRKKSAKKFLTASFN